MRRIIVLGGSVAGLVCAMQLARRGFEVTVVEREVRLAVAPPVDAPVALRAGAPHAVHGHSLLARGAVELRRALPPVYAALLAAGVRELDLIANMPATIADRARRAGDDELVMPCTRRYTLDRVLVEAAEATPGVDLHFGVAAAGLRLARGGSHPPRVTGVELANGDVLAGDVVLDASGRRSLVAGWLAAQGVTLPFEAHECGLVYFSRHYQLRPGVARPSLNRVFATTANLPSLLVRWFPGDNDTAMLVIIVLAVDALLKRVHRVDRFQAVAQAVPAIAPWLECADPTTGVFAMGALRNTLRRTVDQGQPKVLGVHLIGDAACTTNPTGGRGVSYAVAMAVAAAQVISDHADDLVTQALLLDEFIAREIEPRFRENVRSDIARVQQMRADLSGEPLPALSPDPRGVRVDELIVAATRDADLYRALMRYVMVLRDAPDLADPSLVEQVRRRVPAESPSAPREGPTRAELVQLLAGSY
jgi:flavin-dependent dehydrogenase